MDIAEAVKQIADAEIEKLILSNPKNKSVPYQKMTVRPLLIQKQKRYQLERFTERQAFQENIEPAALAQVLSQSLQEEYSQLDGWSHEASYWIKISKKGKVFFKEKAARRFAGAGPAEPKEAVFAGGSAGASAAGGSGCDYKRRQSGCGKV